MFGRFAGAPTQQQLDRYFHLDDADLALVERCRRDRNRLGFALQLTTARFLGTFLSDPLDVPWAVVEFLAAQLGIAEASSAKEYAARLTTQHEHARQIREEVGYRGFSGSEAELRAWREARAWTLTERPSVNFDRATSWLLEHKVLLPGPSILARTVNSALEAVASRLCLDLAALLSGEQVERLEKELLEVRSGSRLSGLERLRNAPTTISSEGLVKALDRLAEVRKLGVSALDVTALPVGRVAQLARFAMGAKAQALSRLAPQRRAATLLAVAKHLEVLANDDALDLFSALSSRLLSRAGKASDKERLGQLPRLAEASAELAIAVSVLFEADEEMTLGQLWAEIEGRVPRANLEAATTTVANLASQLSPEDSLASQLVDRYRTARRFLPSLIEVMALRSNTAGQPVLDALEALPGLWRRRKAKVDDVPLGIVTPAWRLHVMGEAGELDKSAYALCAVEALHKALQRRDVFCPASSRWADPRACLLDGERWSSVRTNVLEGLNLDPDPARHLERLGAQLDRAYRDVIDGLEANVSLTLDEDGRPHLHRDEALAVGPSLLELRRKVKAMLPRADLPEVLLEVDAWTGFTSAFTHLDGPVLPKLSPAAR